MARWTGPWWQRRRRTVVLAALAADSRILRSWELEPGDGRRLVVPEGTRTVHIGDPDVLGRIRVELGRQRRGRD